MGLLGDSIDDPKSMATWQLVGGLLSPGSFGQGLSRGMSGYQGTMANAQDMNIKQQKLAMEQMQFAQQKRMFDLQTPFLEEAVRRMQGSAAPQGNAPVPSEMSSPGVASSTAPQTGLGMQSPQGAPQGSPQAAPQQRGSLFPGVPDDAAFGVIGAGGFSKIPDMIMKANEPTELIKTMRAAGIDPNSPLGRQYLQSNLAKSNYIAPVNGRPGSILRDPVTQQPIAFNPHIPEGGTPVFDASGNVTAINPLQGATGVMQAGAAAVAAGKAQYTPYSGYDEKGNPAPVSSVANVLSPTPNVPRPAASTPAEPVGAGTADSIKAQIDMVRSNGGQPITAAMKPAIDREVQRLQNELLRAKSNGGSLYATQPMGADKAATNAQTSMTEKWNPLNAQVSTLPTVNNYLDQIKDFSAKASTGLFTDKLHLVNSLLAKAGSEQAADTVTATNLLNKYSNQIVAQLGSGGMATDAARSILASAYPNAHMNVPAIHEAVDSIKAVNDKQIAKAQILLPAYNAKDPDKYQTLEQQFDIAADPRIFQWKSIRDPAQRKAYGEKIMSQDPSIAVKAKTLEALGVK